METQKIGQDSRYGTPIGQIKIMTHVEINRELTIEENMFISRKVEEMVQLIAKNTELADATYQASLIIERSNILACFDQPIYVKEIPNGYSSRMNNPWFEVTTTKGIITIGWRKRVINIDWSKSDSRVTKEYMQSKINPDRVTLENTYIHADSYVKAKQYIDLILNQLEY